MNTTRKIMVRCDMEGLTGVVSYDQVIPGKREYAFGQSMLMADLLALIEGLRAGGCEQIVCYDQHFDGRNIDLAQIPEGVTVYCGRPPYRPDWAGGLDASFSGLIMLGVHSRHGTPNGLLCHTYEHNIRELVLNGVTLGEIGMEAAIAGDFGVSLQLVVGDSAMVTEAKELISGVVGVSVKESLGVTSGLCYPPSQTSAGIRAAAQKVAQAPPPVAPYRVRPPVKLQVRLNDGDYLDALRRHYRDQFEDERTLLFHGRTVREVWGAYWHIKLSCHDHAKLSIHSDMSYLPPSRDSGGNEAEGATASVERAAT